MRKAFYDTQLTALSSNAWRVEKRGALQTIRFDRASLHAVDFERSHGVIGQRRFEGSLYVALDPAVAEPIITLRDDNKYWIQPEEPIAYLVESRWIISELDRSEGRLDFNAQGYGPGEMVWHVPIAGSYRITVNGKSEKVDVGPDKILKFRIEDNAIPSLHVTIVEAQNA